MPTQNLAFICLKESIQVDLPARARFITDAAEHTQVLTQLLDDPFSTEFEEWVANSPLLGGEFL